MTMAVLEALVAHEEEGPDPLAPEHEDVDEPTERRDEGI